MIKNILVTGASGFVGYHLVKHLALSNKIYCIVRKDSNLSKLTNLNNVNTILYDGSLDCLRKQITNLHIDLIYHLSSLFIAEHKSSQVDDLINSNILFPTQLLEVLAELNSPNFINTGTAWQNYTDNIKYDPVCLYAATKQSFEDILEYYHQVKNFNCITLRLYDTYGINDNRHKLFHLLNELKLTGNYLDMSLGEQMLNLVYIDDVIMAYELAGIRLLESKSKQNTIYGVYNSVEYSLRDVVKIFEQVNDCKLNINWGKRNYRTREIMYPNKLYKTLPEWSCKVTLYDGLIKLKNANG